MRKLQISLWIMLTVWCLAATAQAELLLVENFETQTSVYLGAPCTGVAGGIWDTESNSSGNVALETITGSRVVRFMTTTGGDRRGVGFTDVTNPINEDETGVIFFRFMERADAQDPRTYIGLHTFSGANFLTTTTANANQIAAGFGLMNNGAGGYNVTTTLGGTVLMANLVKGQWYNAWIVANNAADTFDLYIRTAAAPGGAAELPDLADQVGAALPFGRATTSPLIGLLAFGPTVASLQSTRTYLDDIYWDGDQGLKTKLAKNPVPGNNADMAPVDQVLFWEAPDYPTISEIAGYDVYLDPNETKVRDGDLSTRVSVGQSGLSYDPAQNFPNEQRYFWRVDVTVKFSDDPNQLLHLQKGSVWNFITAPLTPVVTIQPLPQVRGAANGKPDAVFTVDAVNTATYQWLKNGNPVVDNGRITGAKTAALTITGVQSSDEGQYSCQLANGPKNVTLTDTVWLEYARQTGQWEFEQNLVDGVGGNNGTFSDPNFPDGQFGAGKVGGYALTLDGVNKHVTLPVVALPKAGTGMSFAFWAFNNTPTVGTTALYASTLAAPDARLVNAHTPWSSNTTYFDISNPDATGSPAYDRVGLANALVLTDPARWAYWVFTKDVETGIMRIFRDGVQVAQATGMARRLYGAEQFYLGRSGTTPQYFNGMVDDLRIYNYALDNVAIAYLYTDVTGSSVCVNAQDPVLVQFDYNTNCIIDLGDFAVLASHWMACQLVPDCIAQP